MSVYTYTTLDDPMAFAGTFGSGINDSGQIVGFYLGRNRDDGFLLSGGTYTTLDDPMGDATVAYGINISGQIVGYYQTGNFFHGFLLSGGTYTTLDDPSAGQVQSQGTFAHGSAEIGGAGVIASLSLGC